jgi:hypothetical protein
MTRPIRYALATLLAALPLAPLHAQQPTPARLAASIDSFVQAEVLARGITGVSLVVARAGAAPGGASTTRPRTASGR